jgi:hypothetical protein
MQPAQAGLVWAFQLARAMMHLGECSSSAIVARLIAKNMRGIRVKTIKLIAFIIGAGFLLAPAANLSAEAAVLTFQCVNVASKAKWTVKVDDTQKTADGFPATISADDITWSDRTTGGTYELDRATGKLTYVASTSMGGYMLFHRCQLEK